MSPADGKVVRTLVVASPGEPGRSRAARIPSPGMPPMTVMRFNGSAACPAGLHAHPAVNAGPVLRGRLTVVAENSPRRTFRSGKGIVETVGTPRYAENRSDEPLEPVVCYACERDVRSRNEGKKRAPAARPRLFFERMRPVQALPAEPRTFSHLWM